MFNLNLNRHLYHHVEVKSDFNPSEDEGEAGEGYYRNNRRPQRHSESDSEYNIPARLLAKPELYKQDVMFRL